MIYRSKARLRPYFYRGAHRPATLLDRFRALFTRPTPADTALADMFDEPGIDTTVPLAVA